MSDILLVILVNSFDPLGVLIPGLIMGYLLRGQKFFWIWAAIAVAAWKTLTLFLPFGDGDTGRVAINLISGFFGGAAWSLITGRVNTKNSHLETPLATDSMQEPAPELEAKTNESATPAEPAPQPLNTERPSSLISETRKKSFDGIMRLRIVGAAIVLTAASIFAASHIAQLHSERSDAFEELDRYWSSYQAFLQDQDVQELCDTEEAYFSEHPPPGFETSGDNSRASFALLRIEGNLQQQLRSTQRETWTCNSPLIPTDDCNYYRSFADLYADCTRRNRAVLEERQSKEQKCSTLKAQQSSLEEQIAVIHRYWDYSDQCFQPASLFVDASKRSEETDRAFASGTAVHLAFVAFCVAAFWGIGSLLGWIVRGFRG